MSNGQGGGRGGGQGGGIRGVPPEVIGYAIQNPEWGQQAAQHIANNDPQALRDQLDAAGLDVSEGTMGALMRLDHQQIHDGLEGLKGQDIAAA